MTACLEKRLQDTPIAAYSLHPGDIDTGLAKNVEDYRKLKRKAGKLVGKE